VLQADEQQLVYYSSGVGGSTDVPGIHSTA
jgi:hypothetical protein